MPFETHSAPEKCNELIVNPLFLFTRKGEEKQVSEKRD